MPSFTAPTFEHELAAKEIWINWSNPTEKLLVVEFVGLGKVLPLPAEVLSRSCFVSVQIS
jgi:hypothetical protein